VSTVDHETIIENLDDTSGTRINGNPLNKQAVKSGDILTIGVNKLSINLDHFSFSLSRIEELEKVLTLQYPFNRT